MVALNETKEEISKAPIEDLSAVMMTGYGNSLSQELLSRLAEANVPVIIASKQFLPVGIFTPIVGNHELAQRVESQIALSQPMKKQLWRTTVRSKIRQQSMVLAALQKKHSSLSSLVSNVQSGDPNNVEAHAARIYWPALLGKDFRRDRTLPGINAALNYGYTVMRAAVLRAIVGHGLLPSLGIQHQNSRNPFRLADDLMEPFRPLVDLEVVLMLETIGSESLSPGVRMRLVELLDHDIEGETSLSTVNAAIRTSVYSFVQSCNEKDYRKLNFPLRGPSLDQLSQLSHQTEP
jgi:CRISPR-associated protein Cas1